MTYKWARYDVEAVSLQGGTSLTNLDDGEYVFAEDAINREAENAAEIQTLKTQLKGSRAALQALLNHYVRLVESGDAGNWDAETESVVIEARRILQ